MLSRRSLLAVAALAAVGACTSSREDDADTDDGSVERLTYGDDPAQRADLHRPTGASRGTVVVIHGGFWRSMYDMSLGTPLAADLAGRGWTALNVEYRRVGNGGGYPATFDDLSAAIDLVESDGPVVTLGHSAGGHLALWAAARQRFDPWSDARVAVTHAISQAGVVDLRRAYDEGLGGGAVADFVGSLEHDEEIDPMAQLPLDVPSWLVHGTADDVVPFAYSQDYVAAARKAGADSTLVAVEGADHFAMIDPGTEAWAQQVAVLESIA